MKVLLLSPCRKVNELRALAATLPPHSRRRGEVMFALKAAVNLQLRREIRAARKAKREQSHG